MIAQTNNLKLFNALKLKKNREKYGLFVAEGEKIIKDFLYKTNIKLHSLYSTENNTFNQEYSLISEKTLNKISNQKTPNNAIAIFYFQK